MKDFEERPQRTYRVKVGCGNLYVSVLQGKDNKPSHVVVHRNSKLKCPPSMVCSLGGINIIEREQNRGEICDAYYEDKFKLIGASKKGELVGTSCSDAVAKVLEKENALIPA